MTDECGEPSKARTDSFFDFAAQARKEASFALGAICWALLPVIVFAVIQVFRFGFISSEYPILIIGSIGTLIFGYGYVVVSVVWPAEIAAGKPRHWWMFILAAGGLIPYLFSIYLVIYLGIWALVTLTWNFSLGSLFKDLAFVLIGHFILRKFYSITELGQAVKLHYAMDERNANESRRENNLPSFSFAEADVENSAL